MHFYALSYDITLSQDTPEKAASFLAAVKFRCPAIRAKIYIDDTISKIYG
jgi:hypothetical protein